VPQRSVDAVGDKNRAAVMLEAPAHHASSSCHREHSGVTVGGGWATKTGRESFCATCDCCGHGPVPRPERDECQMSVMQNSAAKAIPVSKNERFITSLAPLKRQNRAVSSSAEGLRGAGVGGVSA